MTCHYRITGLLSILRSNLTAAFFPWHRHFMLLYFFNWVQSILCRSLKEVMLMDAGPSSNSSSGKRLMGRIFACQLDTSNVHLSWHTFYPISFVKSLPIRFLACLVFYFWQQTTGGACHVRHPQCAQEGRNHQWGYREKPVGGRKIAERTERADICTVHINLTTGGILIYYNPQTVSVADIVDMLERKGYFDRTKAISNE